MLEAGLPDTIPAHSVTLACISSNVAITDAMGMIKSGAVDSVIAGGVETMSDVPLRLTRKLRTRLIYLQQKMKRASNMEKLRHFKGIKLKDVFGIEVGNIEAILILID